MPHLTIDNREIDVPPGTTLLGAARRLGIEIPTLCWREGCRPNTTCMVCLVRVRDGGTKGHRDPGRLVPACATLAQDGMCVESETDDVRQVRRAALDLLLSDHAGECRAPCQYACPFDSDVSGMLQNIAAGRLDQAIAEYRRSVPLAAALARLAHDGCERACRRCAVDEAVSIGLVKRYVAEKDLSCLELPSLTLKPVGIVPYRPPCGAPSGKRVAIVGAGPAGLSAAYFLLQRGHACVVFDRNARAGGALCGVAALPADVLDAETSLVEKLGARFELSTEISTSQMFDDLRREHDAVLIATGEAEEGAERLAVDRTTRETDVAGVFAAGLILRPHVADDARRMELLVKAAADGKSVAACIDQFLSGGPIAGQPKLPSIRLGRPEPDELAELATGASSATRAAAAPAVGLTDEQARTEARRCLHCDCSKLDACKLRRYAEAYGADASRYRGQRRRGRIVRQHGEVVYEPGKCILCGLCVQIAQQAGEGLGLTFVGRGFDVCVAVPFDESLAEGLKTAGRRCAEACPTGALTLRSTGSGAP